MKIKAPQCLTRQSQRDDRDSSRAGGVLTSCNAEDSTLGEGATATRAPGPRAVIPRPAVALGHLVTHTCPVWTVNTWSMHTRRTHTLVPHRTTLPKHTPSPQPISNIPTLKLSFSAFRTARTLWTAIVRTTIETRIRNRKHGQSYRSKAKGRVWTTQMRCLLASRSLYEDASGLATHRSLRLLDMLKGRSVNRQAPPVIWKYNL